MSKTTLYYFDCRRVEMIQDHLEQISFLAMILVCAVLGACFGIKI